MDILERIKNLASKRDISINALEEKLGFARGYLYTWKKKTPGIDRVKNVAEYFNVSVDYLLGNTDDPDAKEIDLKKAIDNNQTIFTWEGKQIPEEDIELIKRLLRRD